MNSETSNGTPQTTQQPDADHPTNTQRVYYLRNNICITSQQVLVDSRKYAIADLGEVWTVKSGGALPVTIVAIVSLATWLLSIWTTLKSSSTWRVVAISAAIAISMLGFAAFRATRRREYQLWAECRGMESMILKSTDSETYGQICRALIRAKETSQQTDR